MKIPKISEDNAKGLAVIAIVAVVVIIVVVFGSDLKQVVDNILQGLGLTKDPQTQQAQQNAVNANQSTANPSSVFSPQLYNNNPEASTLDYATLKSMADTIYGSVSNYIFYSSADSSQALSAIKQCNNQVDVSNLVIVFQQLYNEDLYDYMAKFYTSATNLQGLNQILTFANSLPKQ